MLLFYPDVASWPTLILLCLDHFSNIIPIIHPQLKRSPSTLSGNRRCPNFSRVAPRPAWRSPDHVLFAGQPSPALSRHAGQYYMSRPHAVLTTLIANTFAMF